MTRHKDWEARLIAYLTGVASKPFAAGQHDCALFTAGAVKAMTGTDHGSAWAGRYRSIRAGVRALKKAGHTDHVALVASLLDEVAPAFALPGDVAVMEGAEGFGALGIVQGEGVYVLTETGMAIQPRSQMLRAFKV